MPALFSTSFFPTVRSVDASEALHMLRELYGDELAPILLAVGEVESRLEPHAIGDGGISRGFLQVNTEAWGSAAAPMSDGLRAIDLLRWQAQAARDVIEDAKAGAAELVELAGAPYANAFDLVWQYGRARARQFVAGVTWSRDAIVARIRALKNDAAAEAWRLRDQAFEAAYNAGRAELERILGAAVSATASAGAFFLPQLLLILLVVWLLSNRERRAKTFAIGRAIL